MLLVVLCWILVLRAARGTGDTSAGRAADAVDASAATAAAPGAVGHYLRFASERRAQQEASHSHEYTAGGLRRLAAALGDVLGSDTTGAASATPLLETMRRRADDLQRNPASTEHARYAREGFAAAAGAIGVIQARRFPNLASEAEEVQGAADAVRSGQLLLEQRAQVQQFFDQAATALRAMTSETS
jgi:hypothetical protein